MVSVLILPQVEEYSFAGSQCLGDSSYKWATVGDGKIFTGSSLSLLVVVQVRDELEWSTATFEQ